MGKSNVSFILICLLFGSLISNSNQFNLNLLFSRRHLLKQTISSLGCINLNANNFLINDYSENDESSKNDESDENNYNLLSQNINNNKRSNFLNNNIYLTGSLNEETCFKLTEALINHKNMALTNQDYPNHINLYIQSPGGSLLPTLGVVDEIRNLEIPVHTYIRGYAASAATLLSVAGSERFIYNHSVLMIHGVKLNEQTVNSLLDIKDLNNNVDVFMNLVKQIYLENTNIDENILEYYFYHDLWMNSTLALKYGLVDKII